MIRLIFLTVALIPVIILAKSLEKFDDEVFLGHEQEFDSSLEPVGQGVDSGPSDIGHELHAKIEEAAEKALALITHATKYLDDATQHQSEKDSISVPSMKEKDAEGKSWERAKRAVYPVPQTDSDAAKGSSETQRLFKRQALDEYEYESEIDGLNAERVHHEGEKKSEKEKETGTKDEDKVKDKEEPADEEVDDEPEEEDPEEEDAEEEAPEKEEKDEPEDKDGEPEDEVKSEDELDDEAEAEGEEEPKEDTKAKPKKTKGPVRQGFALGDSPTESPVTPATLNPTGVVTIPGTIPEKGSKDKASNPWWDAVHGITPEKLDHLITAINEMNELFAGLIERYDAANGAPMPPENE